jgi:hypothetical protein
MRLKLIVPKGMTDSYSRVLDTMPHAYLVDSRTGEPLDDVLSFELIQKGRQEGGTMVELRLFLKNIDVMVVEDGRFFRPDLEPRVKETPIRRLRFKAKS